jgi:tetratricopeptide (TPR) repeat protein
MNKIGRNEPCPCGSGKKYKKCCLPVPQLSNQGGVIYTDLDDLSNQVPDLIEQKKFAEAEDVCNRLIEQYPEQIDCLHRYAELFEAQEEKQKAAVYYRKAADFAEQADGFDQNTVDFFRKKAGELAGNDKE